MTPFIWFLLITGGISLFFGWIIWYTGIFPVMAAHVQENVADFAWGIALILAAMLASFDQNFASLTRVQMESMTWLNWAILFFKPLAAGLAVFIALVKPKIGVKPNVRHNAAAPMNKTVVIEDNPTKITP